MKSEAVLPKRYANRGLNDLDSLSEQDDALDAAKRWIAELRKTDKAPSWGILLAGAPGVGKTAIACALAHDALGLGTSVSFVTAADLRYALMRQMTLVDIIRKLDKLQGDEPELIEHRTRSEKIFEWRNSIELFVLDDLGAEMATDSSWFRDELVNLIRHRGDRGLANVVTTNVDREARAARYGQPFESYLHEIGERVGIDGKDRRRG